jgi:hypothetical protein
MPVHGLFCGGTQIAQQRFGNNAQGACSVMLSKKIHIIFYEATITVKFRLSYDIVTPPRECLLQIFYTEPHPATSIK